MRALLAMAGLTWKAAFRFRLFWALAGLLIVSVVGLPLLVKDDGTPQGFIQILLTYNLGVMTTLLGLATLWISCGLVSREIEDCELQLVAVKPVGRWQIWLGKWLGVLFLNTVFLTLAGGSVYGLLLWRERALPEAQRRVLRNEVFVARASIRQPLPDLNAEADRLLRERLAQVTVPPAEQPQVRRDLLEQLKAGMQIVPPNYLRTWQLDLGLRQAFLRDQPLYLHFKFHAAQTNLTGSYQGAWRVGPPGSTQATSHPMDLAADTFHEIEIPPNLWDPEGKLTVQFLNQDRTALLFPLEDGFEVLYREGGFALNYVRGLLIILSWLGLLAALGLAAGSLLSFPVAAFLALSVLVVALSGGVLAGVVEEGTVTGIDHETGAGGLRWVDAALLPLFKATLKLLSMVESFSPVASLSAGRSITWGQLAQAWGQIVFLLGGLLAVAGMVILHRRELALPQGRS